MKTNQSINGMLSIVIYPGNFVILCILTIAHFLFIGTHKNPPKKEIPAHHLKKLKRGLTRPPAPLQTRKMLEMRIFWKAGAAAGNTEGPITLQGRKGTHENQTQH